MSVRPQIERFEVHVWQAPPDRPRRRDAEVPVWLWVVALPVACAAAAVALLVVAIVAVGAISLSAWTALRAHSPGSRPPVLEDPSEAAVASLRDAYSRGVIELSEFEERVAWALRYLADAWPPAS